MAKQSSRTNTSNQKRQKVDYEPIKVGLAVAAFAAVSLVLIAFITMY